MTDEQFEYLWSNATEHERRRVVRMLRSFAWRLRHPRISKWLDAMACVGMTLVR
jgi:hypothetical protein